MFSMGSTPRRKPLRCGAILCMVLFLNLTTAASSAKKSSGDTDSGDGAIPDAVAGPIVRAVVDRLKVANTTDAMDKKKTIAQMIDEALEQEFPEEKQEKIGKNYNETAKNSDVSRQSVVLGIANCIVCITLQGSVSAWPTHAGHR